MKKNPCELAKGAKRTWGEWKENQTILCHRTREFFLISQTFLCSMCVICCAMCSALWSSKWFAHCTIWAFGRNNMIVSAFECTIMDFGVLITTYNIILCIHIWNGRDLRFFIFLFLRCLLSSFAAFISFTVLPPSHISYVEKLKWNKRNHFYSYFPLLLFHSVCLYVRILFYC